jgi:hypothetical protein
MYGKTFEHELADALARARAGNLAQGDLALLLEHIDRQAALIAELRRLQSLVAENQPCRVGGRD